MKKLGNACVVLAIATLVAVIMTKRSEQTANVAQKADAAAQKPQRVSKAPSTEGEELTFTVKPRLGTGQPPVNRSTTQTNN